METFALEEHRTKSELFREMVRIYRRCRDQRDREEGRSVANLVREAKAEEAKRPMTADEMLAEGKRLAEVGAKHARKLGIKADLKSAIQIIHERRKSTTPTMIGFSNARLPGMRTS